MSKSEPRVAEPPEPIGTKFCTSDYVISVTLNAEIQVGTQTERNCKRGAAIKARYRKHMTKPNPNPADRNRPTESRIPGPTSI